MDDIKISVIMPVYKVEQYVAKAIESIQRQTLASFEFLIVDDGSPDKSGNICDEYASKDSRIHVIHKANEGAPSARNSAINIARGKYLYFLDSDDWAEPTMLEDMYNLAETNGSQLVITGFYIDTYYKKDKYITSDYIPEAACYQTKEDFRNNAYKLFDKNMLYPPWNKLYQTEYIKHKKLYFPKTLWDDFPFNLSVIRDIEHVSVTSKQYYHFLRARAESETSKYIPNMYEKREEEHDWMNELFGYWRLGNDLKSQEMIARRYIDRLIGCFENITNPNCSLSFKEKKHVFKTMLNSNNTKHCIRVVKPQSVYAKIIYRTIRCNTFLLVYLEALLITYVKRKNIKIFSILKMRR